MIAEYNRKIMAAWVGGGLLVLGLMVLLLVDFDNPPDIALFIGRFHPTVVHFPIGFLVLGGLLEVVSRYYPEMEVPASTIIFVLLLGAVAAFVAVGAGFFLSLSGGYNDSLIGWHRWLGILVAAGAFGAVALKLAVNQHGSSTWERVYYGVLTGTVGLLLTTGHLGGTLTHGSGYLTEYLPQPVKWVTGLGGETPANRTIVHVDSAEVFPDLVQPILNDRCVSCHNENKTKGDLRLDVPEQIMEGGEDGEIIVAGEPEQSEIVRRITLPLYHDDRMPPDSEEPLTVEQTELIRWWIETGASFDMKVAEVPIEERPSSVRTVLARLSRPAEEMRTGIYALDVSGPDSSVIERLNDDRFAVRRIAQDGPFLEVEILGMDEPVGRGDLDQLRPLFPQVAWLDMSGLEIAGGVMAEVGDMEHLTRLHLQNSSVTDEGLEQLEAPEYLKYLNLYGTEISDAGLEALGNLENLETIYLWQTNVSENAVDQWKQQHRGVTVNRGARLVSVDSTDVSPNSKDY